jgi:hypothetical protein
MIDDYNQGFTRIKPQSRRAHRGRTDGDDDHSEANMLFLSSAHNKENGTSLRLIIVAE